MKDGNEIYGKWKKFNGAYIVAYGYGMDGYTMDLIYKNRCYTLCSGCDIYVNGLNFHEPLYLDDIVSFNSASQTLTISKNNNKYEIKLSSIYGGGQKVSWY